MLLVSGKVSQGLVWDLSFKEQVYLGAVTASCNPLKIQIIHLFFSKISHKLLLPSSQLLHNQASKKNSPSHIHSSNCGFSPSVDTTPLNLFSNLNRYFPILTSCELSSVACCCLLWIPFFLLLLWGHNLPSFLLPFWLLLLSCLCHFLSLSFIFVYLCGLLIFQWYYLKCDKKYKQI